MAWVNRSGLTVLSTMESGEKTEPMVREDSSMLMETYMMDTGLMTRQMVWELTSMSMGHSMKACGRTTCNMGTVSRHGLTSLDMKGSTPSAGSMALEVTNGTMAACILVTGGRIRSVELEFIHGLMEGGIRVNGWTIIWREWASTFGMMAECIRDSIKTIRNMGSESILGPIRDAMKDIGIRGNSMD